MIQEEKAKRYGEAVKKAEEIIKYYKTHNRSDEASIEDLETIFPELKESENERIKQELICFLETEIPQCNARDKYIDWLEKKTLIIPKFRVGDEIKTANEESLTITKIDEKGYWSEDLFICGFDDECLWDLVKGQSVEPDWCHHKVDFSGCSEEYRKAYYDGWNDCNMQHSQCNAELDDVIKCLINGFKYYYDETNEEIVWGTHESSMPVKHIIEVLERLIKMHNHIHKVNE